MKIFVKEPVFAVCSKVYITFFFKDRKMEAGSFVDGERSKDTEWEKKYVMQLITPPDSNFLRTQGTHMGVMRLNVYGRPGKSN